MKSYLLIVFILLLLTLPLFECSRTSTTNINRAIDKNVIPTKSSNNDKSTAAINGLKNSIASGMAAACAKTLLAPFDTIKTIQQQSRYGEKALGLVEATKIIMARPGGFFELYVSVFFLLCEN